MQRVRIQSGLQGFINLCRINNISLKDSFYLYVHCKTVKSDCISIRECMLRAQSMKTVRESWYSMHVSKV